METIRYYVIIFSFINTGFSPIVVIIIYCFSKEHFKFIKGMFCCCLKKEEQLFVNITKEAASLFEGSVVTINAGSALLLEQKYSL